MAQDPCLAGSQMIRCSAQDLCTGGSPQLGSLSLQKSYTWDSSVPVVACLVWLETKIPTLPSPQGRVPAPGWPMEELLLSLVLGTGRSQQLSCLNL